MRYMKVVICILLVFIVLLFQGRAQADDSAEVDHCLGYAGWDTSPPRFSREEREQGERLVDWGARLADGLLRVEAVLASDGMVAEEISASNFGWAAVLEDDHYRIGLYRVNDETLELLQRYTNDPDDALASRFALAEQALILTPQDCGQSFGVLDLGLRNEQARYLHAIRLVDRSRDIAWGMHYGFRVTDGALDHVDRLHLRCSVLTWNSDTVKIIEKPSTGSVLIQESLPGMDLPTEAQFMQMHLYPDIPEYATFEFWTQGRLIHFADGPDSFPERYHRAKNPCAVDSTEN